MTPLKTKDYIHIIKRKNKWIVKRPNAKRALKVEKYIEIAFLYACQCAKEEVTVITVHNEDGTVKYTFEIENTKDLCLTD